MEIQKWLNDQNIEPVQDRKDGKDYWMYDNLYTEIDLIELLEAFSLHVVGYWVAIESTEQPEIMTDVMVKYKDGRKEVAYFDGDKRFYIEKDDRDVTETIVEWHKLP